MSDVIRLENVTFGFNRNPVVENVSLTIGKGEFFGLVGPNGSGKTTLLKLLLGSLKPDSGQITVFGESVDEFSDGERIGYVPQRSSRKGNTMPITVREVVAMGRFPHGPFRRLGDTDRAIVDDALETVSITDLSDRRISELSGGQKQRVFIARALASKADLLTLDEPTVGVDAASRDDFFMLLDELNNKGITIILIEHDLNTVTNHADRIACINRSLHYVGPPNGFIERSVQSNTQFNYGEEYESYNKWRQSSHAIENRSD